jgi:hypothetical protein
MFSFIHLLNQAPRVKIYNYRDFARYYIGDIPNDMTTEILPVSIQLEWEELICLGNYYSLGRTSFISFIKKQVNSDLRSYLRKATTYDDLQATHDAIEQIEIDLPVSKLEFVSEQKLTEPFSEYKDQPEQNITLASEIWVEGELNAKVICLEKIAILKQSVELELRQLYKNVLEELKPTRFYQMLEEALLKKEMKMLHLPTTATNTNITKKTEYFFYKSSEGSQEKWFELIDDLWGFLINKKFIDTDKHSKTDFNTLFSEHSDNHKTINWEGDRQSLGVLGKHLPSIVEPQKQKMKIISERFRLIDDLKLTAEQLSQAAKGNTENYKQNGKTIWNFLNDLS